MNLLNNSLKYLWLQKNEKLQIAFHQYRYLHLSVKLRSYNVRKNIVPFPTLDQIHVRRNYHSKKYMGSSTYEKLVSQSKLCQTNENTKEMQTPKPNFRHQFKKETEDIINRHITEEFNAAFAYLSMACYFGRSDIALVGCQGFFTHMYEEELSHAMVLINYILLRGGYVILSPIQIPENQDWKSIVNALTTSLDMEKTLKEKLNAVFEVAEKHKDLHVMDLISTQFMEEQNRSICELSRLLTKAKLTEDQVGLHLFDMMVFDSFVKKSKDNSIYKRTLNTDASDGVYK